MIDNAEDWPEEPPDDWGEPEWTRPGGMVELKGGPLDGRCVPSEYDVEWLALGMPDSPEHPERDRGTFVAYRPTSRRTGGGLPIFEWVEDPPPEVMGPE